MRALVFDDDLAERDRPRRAYAGEDDPVRIAELVRGAFEEATTGRDFDAVGASCFGHSLLALDDNGRPLTPILGWRDTRSADAADWLTRRLDAVAVHARTGCQIHTSYWPAKFAWLAQEQPEVFRNAAALSPSATTSTSSSSGARSRRACPWLRRRACST